MTKRLTTFLYIGLLLLLFTPLVISGNRAANDFPLASKETVELVFNLPQTWSTRGGNGLGENIIFTLWSWPIDFVFGFGAKLGASFNLLTKVIFILPTLAIAIISIKKLMHRAGVKGKEQYPGILFFLANTYLLLLIDGGQLSIALAYALIPLTYIYSLEALVGKWHLKLKAALTTSLLAMVDIRFAYILIIVLIIRFLFELFYTKFSELTKLLFNWILLGITSFIVWMVLNLYWTIPLFLFRNSSIPTYLTSGTQLSFLNFTQQVNSLLLQHPNWPLNSFGRVSLPDWKFILIPVFTTLIFFKNKINKEVLFFSVILLVGVFLSKGSNDPGGSVYEWLFSNFPGFFLFRDSSKFFTLVALSMSVLISTGLSFISEKFKKIQQLPQLLFGIYILILVSPVWLGKMTGLLSSPQFQVEYKSAEQSLRSDSNFGRVLWLPSRPPLGHADPTHPSVEGLTIASKRPFSTANVGTYERFNFLREAEYSSDLLKIAGVSYVAYPYPDERKQIISPDDKAYYNNFTNQLSNTNWYESTISKAPITIFKTNIKPEMFKVANNLWWIVGDDTFYEQTHLIKDFNIDQNPFTFTEDATGSLNRYSFINFGKIILFEKNEDDFYGTYLADNRPDLLDNLNISKGNTWRVNIDDLQSWRQFLQEKYKIDNTDFQGRTISLIAEGDTELTLPASFTDKHLLLRVLISTEGGSIEIVDGDKSQQITTINYKSDFVKRGIKVGSPNTEESYSKAEFHWFIVPIEDTKDLTIKLRGKLNAIAGMYTISDSSFAQAQKRFSELKEENKVIFWDELSKIDRENLFKFTTKGSVNWESISPTKHNVSLKAEDKQLLVFSQSYDQNWEAGKYSTIPLHALINGFVVEPGETQVLYTPQKYISGKLIAIEVVIVVIILVMIIRKSRYEKN